MPQIARQVAAEGAKRVVVVTDEPDKYPAGTEAGRDGVSIHHRDELDAVQRELAEIPGCTVLIYDQTCAAEKRRRRKRGTFPDPDKRVIINELVCEGCGDCGVQSNCVSVQPLETEWGRKRTIDQSSCNKDFSCLKGFCPSFVTVQRRASRSKAAAAARRRRLAGAARAASCRAIGQHLRHHRHRRRRHRRRHHRRAPRHGGASRRQGRRRARHGRPRAEGRRGAQPRAHRREAGGHPRHPRRRARRRPGARRRHRGRRQQEGAGRGRRPARPRWSSTSPRCCPASSPATPTISLPTERLKRAIAAAAGDEQHLFLRRVAHRQRGRRPVDRRQHGHARLRLSGRRAAAVGASRSSARSSSTARRWR